MFGRVFGSECWLIQQVSEKNKRAIKRLSKFLCLGDSLLRFLGIELCSDCCLSIKMLGLIVCLLFFSWFVLFKIVFNSSSFVCRLYFVLLWPACFLQ